MLTKSDMAVVDWAIRETLLARKKAMNFTYRGLGKVAFGFLGAPHGKVQAMLAGQGKTGDSGFRQPQVIGIGELYNLCEAMGLSWNEVLSDAFKKVKRTGS